MPNLADPCVASVALSFFEELNTPVSLSCAIKLRYHDYEGLARASVTPTDYALPFHFHRDAAAVSFLRKWEELPSTTDRKGEALKAFFQSERDCYAANQRITSLSDTCLSQADLVTDDTLNRAAQIIRRVLGRLPDDLHGRFGPGTCIGVMSHTTVCDKLASLPTYYGYLPLLQRLVPHHWENSSGFRRPLRVRGNRFTTVPKDAKTDRGICIEASLNVYSQLGVGSEIRSRLKKVGIDLQMNQSLHRDLAKLASKNDSLATIDLSRASDTLCKALVAKLFSLSPEWFGVLDSLRAPSTEVEGKWYRLEKFSSMGNGYTFELETLCFYALAKALSPLSEVFVYGDDIIVPTHMAADLVALLRFCGFTPNPQKTYVSGPFRESCGGDFFSGVPVRGYYLKNTPTMPADFFAIFNGLCRLEDDLGNSSLKRTKREILHRIPRQSHLFGPRDFGDSVLWTDNRDLWTSTKKQVGGVLWVRGFVAESSSIPLQNFHPRTQLAAALYGVPSRGPIPRTTDRRSRVYRKRWLAWC